MASKKKKPPSPRTLKSLFKAQREGRIEKVQKALDGGLDPSTVFDVQENEDPWSLLYHAAFHGQDEIARLLLERGADPKFATGNGSTPLHHARSAALVEALVAAGADPDARTQQGRAPLHGAANAEVVAALAKAGADLEAESAQAQTPYETAHTLAVRLALVDAGAKGLRNSEGVVLEVRSEPAAAGDVSSQGGAIGAGADGALWFAGYPGVFRVMGDEVTRVVLPLQPAFAAIGSAHGTTYFATNQGLLALRDSEWRHYTTATSPLCDDHIVAMSVVDDAVWLVGYESEAEAKHVSVFDGRQWRLLRPGVDLPSEDCPADVIARDAQGRLLLSAGFGKGPWLQDGDGWSSVEIGEGFFTPKLDDALAHDGITYLATSGGLHLRREGEESAVLFDGDNVGALAVHDGALWAATDSALHEIRSGEVARSHEGLSGSIQTIACAGGHMALQVQYGDSVYFADGSFTPVTAPPPPVEQVPVELLPFPDAPLTDRALLPAEWVSRVNDTAMESLDADTLIGLVRPAIGMSPGGDPTGRSKLGGVPDVPEGFEWPTFPESDDHLPFILQIDCEAAAPFDVQGLLPTGGMLYLFSDTDPEAEGVWHLHHAAGPFETAELPESLRERRDVDDFSAELPETPLHLFTQYTLPSGDWIRERAELSDADDDALHALRDSLREASEDFSESQLLGWPDPVQGQLLAGDGGIVLVQLGPMVDVGSWIVDGLRYWLIGLDDLAKGDLAEAWDDYAFT